MRTKFFTDQEPGDWDEPEHELVLTGRVFESQYPGKCAVDYDHKVKRGDKVSRVVWADNPGIPVPGVACKSCTKILPTE